MGLLTTNGKNGYSNQTYKPNGISKKAYPYKRPYYYYSRAYANRFLGYERRFETAASSKELKSIEISIQQTGTALQPGYFELLNLCVAGTGTEERVSRQLDMKSAFLRYQILFSSTGNAAETIRLIVFVDRQCNASASTPTTAQLLEGGTTSNNVPRQLNLDNKDRFTVLADRHYALSANGQRAVVDKVYIPMNLKVTYGSANNVPITNALYMFWTSGTNDTLTQVTCFSRVRFTDC